MTDAALSTPLMEQYEGVKARYPGHLVLFRVGDFFETFGDDAKLLSKELEVVLTARGPDRRGSRMPMAGVPHHAVETYLGRLVQKGYKVALCDQVEDPRSAKGLVKREVTRVVTPGTVVEERILPGPDHNFLASVRLPAEGPARFAVVDVTTGEWYRGRAPSPGLEGVVAGLAPIAPREVLLETAGGPSTYDALARALRHEFPNVRVEPAPPTDPGFALPEPLASAIGPSDLEADRALAQYVRSTQPRLLPYVSLADRGAESPRLALDAKTLRHLEISRPMNPDDPDGRTLASAWDVTKTPAGHRTLLFWLKNPLADVAAIRARQDAVAWLVGRGAELLAWRRELGGVGDIARIAARLAGRRLRPPELVALRDALGHVAALRTRFPPATELPERLAALAEGIDPLPKLAELLRSAIPDEPPAT
ncbi:MAG TPA: hypothetical protein VLY85_00020, partial [Thermoplasmata archaeon]|nr:hypothetical protein [Thermoplasmata archaeon]